MHRRSAAAEGVVRRHRRRHRQTADRLRLSRADHELSGAGHADDRADRIRIEGGDRPLLRRHDRDPARDRGDREPAAGKSKPRRCATRRTPCTTSPTTIGRGRTRAPRAAFPPAARGPTNTGRRSAGSTMSMATAIWCARARRLRITRRRRNDGRKAVIPGRASARTRNLEPKLVMPALVAGIHVFLSRQRPRDGGTPGHDERRARHPGALWRESESRSHYRRSGSRRIAPGIRVYREIPGSTLRVAPE